VPSTFLSTTLSQASSNLRKVVSAGAFSRRPLRPFDHCSSQAGGPNGSGIVCGGTTKAREKSCLIFQKLPPRLPTRAEAEKADDVNIKQSLASTTTDLNSALAILADAFARCRKQDMRTAEVFTALEFLFSHTPEQWPIDQFRNGLAIGNEEGRWQTLNASLNGIRLAVAKRGPLRSAKTRN
jgi:hypothetical protein